MSILFANQILYFLIFFKALSIRQLLSTKNPSKASTFLFYFFLQVEKENFTAKAGAEIQQVHIDQKKHHSISPWCTTQFSLIKNQLTVQIQTSTILATSLLLYSWCYTNTLEKKNPSVMHYFVNSPAKKSCPTAFISSSAHREWTSYTLFNWLSNI